MDRRKFVGFTSLVMAGGALGIPKASANEESELITPHLNGATPRNSRVALSSTGQFHHFHYLHITEEILKNPPADGWSTITSLMIEELYIDDFFFRPQEVHKQFHCHQVYISQEQIRNIADGVRVEVTAFIRAANGQPQRNHTFVFNGDETIKQQEEAVAATGASESLRRQRVDFRLTAHGGITVFNSKGQQTITDVDTLDQLVNH